MENYSDSDTSSESEFESNQGSAAESDCDEDEDEPNQSLEPEPSEFYDEYKSALWNPEAQLHTDIKARAELPDPTYEKLPRSWPTRLFDVTAPA
jgi:hypothetical protein